MKSQTEYEWAGRLLFSYFCPINKSCNTKVQRIALFYIWRLLKVNDAVGILYVCLVAYISKISSILTYIFRLLCMSSVFTSFFLSLLLILPIPLFLKFTVSYFWLLLLHMYVYRFMNKEISLRLLNIAHICTCVKCWSLEIG